MRWFRVHWPEGILFSRRQEFRLSKVECRFGSREAVVDVWAVAGHVFSLESQVGLSGLSISGPLNIVRVSAEA